MPWGTLPIKYLGVPLTVGKLSIANCSPLLDRLRNRVNRWTNKNMSYGGRLQLINSVLIGICRYWTSSLFLPKKIIKMIEKILKGFLWGSTRKAKIKWSIVCQPKENGGLGINDLNLINCAYFMNHVCDICQLKESLWVKWIHTEILQGKSIWEIKAKPSDSWVWRKMMEVRNMFEGAVDKSIGNGDDTSFWKDPWHPWDILQNKYPELKRKLHIPDNAKVSSVLHNNEWRIPFGRGWDEQVRNFNNACSGIERKSRNDTWRWKPSRSFTIKEAIKFIRVETPNVDWSKIVWGKHFLPRYAFILWMACWKRMNTLDKLLDWGLSSSNVCVLCGRAVESQDHLFFQCHYSRQVWNPLMKQIGVNSIRTSWHDILENLNTSSSWKTNLQRNLAIFGFASTVYHIWKERNNRIHNGTIKDTKMLLKEIFDSIALGAYHWKGYKCCKQNWELAINLGLSRNIFTKQNYTST